MSIVATEPNQNGTQQAQTQLPAAAQQRQRIVVHDNSQFGNLLDTAKFEHLWRLSQTFASSDLVPEQFRGKAQNCFIGIQMAIRLGVDPFMFLQNCYVVHGRPGIEGKLGIALANSSGVFTGPIQYRLEGAGKTRSCTAYATDSETGELLEMTVDWAMVEAEGWDKKAGSKWKTMPEIMFRYRSAMFLIKAYHPEVLMGMTTKEELEDEPPMPLARVDVQQASPGLDALADRLSNQSKTDEATLVRWRDEFANAATVEAADAIRESTAGHNLSDEESAQVAAWHIEAVNRIEAAKQATANDQQSDKLAADLGKFRDACSAAAKLSEVEAADTALRGPNGRTLEPHETELADGWKAEALKRIRDSRGDWGNKTE